MRNRAKCKLCLDVIESKDPSDYMICKCGQIVVEGGDTLKCSAVDWNNFLRVDDEGNEIVVTIKSNETRQASLDNLKPTKEELLVMLDEMIANVERLPSQAMLTPITHYDYCSLMILLGSILRSEA